jgi:hypothetical protein
MGANVLAVAPRECVMLAGNHRRARLEAAGARPRLRGLRNQCQRRRRAHRRPADPSRQRLTRAQSHVAHVRYRA